MMEIECGDLLDEIEGIQSVERQAVRRGDFSGFDRIAVRKAVLLEQLLPLVDQSCAQRLDQIRRQAEENHRLLGAARKGVLVARRRLDLITRASQNLDTYDSKGRTQSISCVTGSLELRA
jgi:hypothetical protein